MCCLSYILNKFFNCLQYRIQLANRTRSNVAIISSTQEISQEVQIRINTRSAKRNGPGCEKRFFYYMTSTIWVMSDFTSFFYLIFRNHQLANRFYIVTSTRAGATSVKCTVLSWMYNGYCTVITWFLDLWCSTPTPCDRRSGTKSFLYIHSAVKDPIYRAVRCDLFSVHQNATSVLLISLMHLPSDVMTVQR